MSITPPPPAPDLARTRHRRITGGILLIAFGMLFGLGTFVGGIFYLISGLNDGEQFAAPGEHTLSITAPGHYTVWHEVRGIYQGQTHSSTRRPAGLRVQVFNDQTGEQIPLSSNTTSSITTGSTERRSLGTFTAPAPGDYRILTDGTNQSIILYIAPGGVGTRVAMIFGMICAGFSGMFMVLGGIVLLIVGLVTRTTPLPR